jgi:hypothetical protein
LIADCKDCSSDRYRFFLFLGTGTFERVKVSGSKDSAIPAGFLADWPDTEAVGPFAGGSDAGGTDGTAADKPSGWGDWGPGSLVPGNRSSASRQA